MFTQSYNPLSVSDPFYLVKQPLYTTEQLRKRQVAEKRHVDTRLREQRSRQMQSILRELEESEEELRQWRLEIMKRKSKHITNTEREDDLISDWHSDPGCIPREVNAILSPDSEEDIKSSASFEPRSKSAEDQVTEVIDDGSCFQIDHVPHLIGVNDPEDEDDEDT